MQTVHEYKSAGLILCGYVETILVETAALADFSGELVLEVGVQRDCFVGIVAAAVAVCDGHKISAGFKRRYVDGL